MSRTGLCFQETYILNTRIGKNAIWILNPVSVIKVFILFHTPDFLLDRVVMLLHFTLSERLTDAEIKYQKLIRSELKASDLHKQ